MVLPKSLALLAALAAALGCARSGSKSVDRSSGEIPSVCAPRVAPGSMRIDGRLDESAWRQAGETGAFVDPGSGRPSSASKVNASARVAWDEASLYLAVVVEDRAPSSPFSRGEVDPHLWERASAVEVMLQPGDPGDNRDYYELQVDINGAVWDTRFDDYNAPIERAEGSVRFGHQEWSSKVQRAVEIDPTAGRYAVEIAWPWASIAGARAPVPPREGDVWRVNLYSFRDGQREAMAFSPILNQGNFHRASRWGRLRFAGSAANAACSAR
jgi:hypothetical protein